MKRILTVLAAFAMVAALLAFAPMHAVKADAPTINISPIAPIFTSTWPVNTTITFTISDGENLLSNVNELTLKVINPDSSETVLISSVNGFESGPTCKTPNPFPTGVGCSVSAGVATITAPWVINGPGSYAIQVSAKHRSALGEDEELVSVSFVAAEYPAPPSEANAYIKANFGKLGAKRQGCVISQIASMHAHDSFFGPKGGPYDIPLIQATVNGLLASPCQ